MRAKLGIRLLVMIFAGCPLTSYGSPQGVDSADICSLFNIALGNGEALTSGDVLVHEKFFLDSINSIRGLDKTGILVEKSIVSRIVFDFEKNKFAVYRASYRALLDLEAVETGDNDGRTETETETVYGFCWRKDDPKVFQRYWPNQIKMTPRSRFDDDLGAFLGQVYFPDYRMAFGNFMGEAGATKSAREEFLRYQTVDSLESSEILANGNQVIKLRLPEVTVDTPPEVEFVGASKRFEFDRDSSMPIESQVFRKYRFLDGREFPGTTGGARLQMTWQLVSNIHVIKSIRHEGSEGFMHTRQHWDIAKRSKEFHWFSVNEEIDERLVDGTVIRDGNLVNSILDPVKTGADSLRIFQIQKTRESKKGDSQDVGDVAK